jgi:hypothetical protein
VEHPVVSPPQVTTPAVANANSPPTDAGAPSSEQCDGSSERDASVAALATEHASSSPPDGGVPSSRQCDGLSEKDAEESVWSAFHKAAGGCPADPEIELSARKLIRHQLHDASHKAKCIPMSAVTALVAAATENGDLASRYTWGPDNNPGLSKRLLLELQVRGYCPGFWPLC